MIPYGKHDVKLIEALKVAFQIRFRSLTQGSKIEEFEKLVAEMVGEVEAWLERNPLDLYYVIRSIGNRLAI